MQDIALDSLRTFRSTIEAAERGLVTDVVSARNSLSELLDLDWVMPRAVADVSMHWKVIETFLKSVLEGKTAPQEAFEELQAAWAAYRDIEDVFKAHD